jgi:peptidase E
MKNSIRQIIALGGGKTEADELRMARYLLAQVDDPRPRVGYLGTASGDAHRGIARFYALFARLDARLSHLAFFERTPDLRQYLAGQDILIVGGGNTRSMLVVWEGWGLPELLKEAWQNGLILSGVSAGAICWFEQGVTDSYAGDLRLIPCLGWLPGSCCPHYDTEVDRRPTYHAMVASGAALPGLAIDDNALLHFVEGELRIVSAVDEQARVYRVGRSGDAALEVALESSPLPVS